MIDSAPSSPDGILQNEPVVDIHAHLWDCHEEVVLGSVPVNRAPKFAANVARRLAEYPEPNELNTRLAALDAAGIDIQVLSYLSPHTPGIIIDASLCASANTKLSEFVAQAPERLRGFARLHMDDVPSAIKELERCVRTLGLVGPYLPTDFVLDDPHVELFYAAVEDLGVPLFLHGPVPGGASLFQEPRLAFQGQSIGDELTGRYHLGAPWGTIYEETLAALVLIMSGVMDRYPRLRICIAHGGGALAQAAPRIMAGLAVHGTTAGVLRDPAEFERRLGQLWFDSDVQSARTIQFTMDVLGADRVVLGTDFPGWGPHPLHFVVPEIRARLSRNASALLNLPADK